VGEGGGAVVEGGQGGDAVGEGAGGAAAARVCLGGEGDCGGGGEAAL